MDHAEVLDRLDAAFVGPGKLWSIDEDRTDEGVALRGHLAACPACRTEHEALLATAAALAAGAPESLRPPDGARERMLDRVRELGTPRGGGRSATPAARIIPLRRRPRAGVLAGLAAAAVIVLLIAGAALGRLVVPGGEAAQDEVTQLVAAASKMDAVLGQPDHRQARLATRSATDGGSVLVSADRHWLVVVSSALASPPQDHWYGCYLERDGQRYQLGWMQFAERLAYWAGPVEGPPDLGRPGDRFVVMVEPSGDTPELSATF